MYKVVSLFAGCGGCDRGIVGDFDFNNKHYNIIIIDLNKKLKKRKNMSTNELENK